MTEFTKKQKKAGEEMADTMIEMFKEHGSALVLSAMLTSIMITEMEGMEMSEHLQEMHAIITTRGMTGIWVF